MYEDQPNERDGMRMSEKDRVLAWTKDVAASTADEVPRSTPQAPHSKARRVEREPPRVVVNQIVNTPAVVVTRVRPESTPKDEISTKAVIGTVLGATAGAVVAYAMTKSQTPDVQQQKKVAYRTIEAPVTYEPVQPYNDSHTREYSRLSSNSNDHAITAPQLPRSHSDDVIPQSEHSHHLSRPVAQNPIQGVTSPPKVTKVSVADSGHSRASHASSHGKTARQSDFIPVTEVRSAKDVPLPYSRVTSLVTTEERKGSKAGKSSISPKKSVNQVSRRRWKESGGSKHCGDQDLSRS